MLAVVLDTNVLVSGLLNRQGPPAKIPNLILDDNLEVVYDDRILGEYEDVLSRRELRLPQSKVLAIIDQIELGGQYVASEPLPVEGYTDPDDIMFAEVFIASRADVLITGNLRHYKPLLEQNAPVLSPAQFLERFFPGHA